MHASDEAGPPDPIVVTDRVRSSVAALAARLGPCEFVIEPAWEPFCAAACRTITETDTGAERAADALSNPHRSIVVAPSDAIVEFANTYQSDEFGFVTRVAETARPWQRIKGWRVDTTMALWAAGWSTVDLDRIEVPGHEATIEFAIGNARRTSEYLSEP